MRRERTERTESELPLVPLLDILMNLMMFLLMAFVAAPELMMLSADAPAAAPNTVGLAAEDRVTVAIGADSVAVVSANGAVVVVPRVGGRVDSPAVSRAVAPSFGVVSVAAVAAEPGITVDDVVAVMDALERSPEGGEMFDHIAFLNPI